MPDPRIGMHKDANGVWQPDDPSWAQGHTPADLQQMQDAAHYMDVQEDPNASQRDKGNAASEGWNKPGEYVSPGSADFGGFSGGADFYKNIALGDRANNNGLQGQAAGTAAYGLQQMQGDRGPQASENARLVGREASSRQGQQNALAMDRAAAMGQAPSAIGSQTTQAMGGLMGSQASAMGGARGLSGLTGAGLGGSSMGVQASNIGTQGGQARSNEIAGSIGAYGGLAGDVRGQDQARLAQNDQMSNFNADLNDKWRLGQGQNAVNAGKLGNELDLSDQQRYGASMQPGEAQFQADQAMQGIQQGAETDKSAISYAKSQDKRKSDNDLYMGIGGSVVGAAGTAAGGPMGGAAANAGWQAANSGGKPF